jgi:deferrochelatase/peroxidase EfeB
MSEITRRGLLAGVAATGALAGPTGYLLASDSSDANSAVRYSPFGTHQVGIITPAQSQLYLLAFDLGDITRSELKELLKRWTVMATALMAGTLNDVPQNYDSPPRDTGEALLSAPTGLTITFGFGPTLFDDHLKGDRFDLVDKLPRELKQLPPLSRDAIREDESYGDICIQICGENSTAVFHAGRNLIREGFGSARLRWSHSGFNGVVPASKTLTARNLFGFKDGTANPTSDSDFAEHIFVSDPNEPKWFEGGTYLAVRKIKMHLDTWDRSTLREQEAVFGRSRDGGAPLSGGHEHSLPDFSLLGKNGSPLIPTDSHLAIAHSSKYGGKKMLRRGYSYENGLDKVGNIEAGLIFMAFVRSLENNFIPVLAALAKSDALNEYVSHVGTAVFALPPAPADENEYIGSELFL